jgi:hypothetical protein
VGDADHVQLAIAVVYLVHDDDGPLLDLHLSQIERNTTVPYRIYAAVKRLQPQFRQLLAARSEVEICDGEPTRCRGVREHSHYLTQLVDRALADGASHVALLHVDSFPIARGWTRTLEGKLKSDVELAAVALREVGDEVIPRTICLFCPRDFYDTYMRVGSITEQPRGHWLYRDYRRLRPGPDDPGDPYGFALHTLQLGWHRMLRTNAVDDHYVLGGIYDDLVFHLGAAARKRKGFVSPAAPGGGRRGRSIVHRIGSAVVPHRVRTAVPNRVRRLWSPRQVASAEASQRAFESIRARLLADPQGYIDRLRDGQGGDPA